MASAVLLQAPPPGTSVTVGGNLAGWELALILLIVLGATVAMSWPFLRAFARRFERTKLEPETLARLERVEAGLQEMQALQTRVMELEERVDFAERLLPRPEAPRISRSRGLEDISGAP